MKTLLDEFAALAMQSLLHNMAIADKELAIMQREYYVRQYGEEITENQAIAREAYAIALEMIKEKEFIENQPK